MSRTLARLRTATGDPLLVRAGRGLVPTPRAMELKHQVGPVVEQAARLLRPAEHIDLARAARTFTLRTSDGFVERYGPALLTRITKEAPGVRLQFVQKVSRDSSALREGTVDLETGVVGAVLGPEVRARALFRDRFVGVVRTGHPLCEGRLTLERYASAGHILVSRGEATRGPVDEALEPRGVIRQIAAVVSGFAAALTLARATDLVATVPERHTENLRQGLYTFGLPFKVREIVVSLLWHPRVDADPIHRWLRECVRQICAVP